MSLTFIFTVVSMPEGSVEYTVPSSGPSAPMRMCSGRMPTITSRSPRVTALKGSNLALRPPKVSSPASVRWPSMKFMAGLPRKSATNTLAGLLYIGSGGAYCCNRPLSITHTMVESVMASCWSWVT